MKYTVHFRGKPVGDVDIAFDQSPEVDGGEVTLLSGSQEFEAIVRQGALAFANHGFMPPAGQFTGGVTDQGSKLGEAALERLERLCDELALVDDRGNRLVQPSFNFFGSADPNRPIQLMVVLDGERTA